MSGSSTEPWTFTVRIALWPQDQAQIRRIREEVFVQEQNVPLDLEWDDKDPQCTQLLAFAGDEPIGTGRMTPSGHIGRMAVRKPWRSRGVGGSLLTALVNIAREAGLPTVFLNAQIRAVPFYARHGFQAQGEVFLDAGIPHRHMRRALTESAPEESR